MRDELSNFNGRDLHMQNELASLHGKSRSSNFISIKTSYLFNLFT